MRYEMEKIQPASAARLVGILLFAVSGIASLIALLGMLIVAIFMDSPVLRTGWLVAIAPFLYGACGYLIAFVICAIYNAAASRFGGIVVELTEAGREG